jgi:hypothetical protein
MAGASRIEETEPSRRVDTQRFSQSSILLAFAQEGSRAPKYGATAFACIGRRARHRLPRTPKIIGPVGYSPQTNGPALQNPL